MQQSQVKWSLQVQDLQQCRCIFKYIFSLFYDIPVCSFCFQFLCIKMSVLFCVTVITCWCIWSASLFVMIFFGIPDFCDDQYIDGYKVSFQFFCDHQYFDWYKVPVIFVIVHCRDSSRNILWLCKLKGDPKWKSILTPIHRNRIQNRLPFFAVHLL